MTLPSLKALAEAKTAGVQKTTQFKLNPRLIEIEPGFNARPLNREHIEAMKSSFQAGATFPPVMVRVLDGRIILVDGHHRVAMYSELMDDGLDIQGVDAIQFRGNDADRVAYMLTSAEGLPLTPLEKAKQFRRLIGFGWDVAQVAAKVGRTTGYVSELLLLSEANSDVQRAVTDNEVAAHLAVKMVRQHGERAGAVIAKHLAEAKAAGRTKVTAKDTKTMSLDAAIRLEISSDGATRAEDSCPQHAKLIAYLRGSL